MPYVISAITFICIVALIWLNYRIGSGDKKLQAAYREYESGRKSLKDGYKQYENGKYRLHSGEMRYQNGMDRYEKITNPIFTLFWPVHSTIGHSIMESKLGRINWLKGPKS